MTDDDPYQAIVLRKRIHAMSPRDRVILALIVTGFFVFVQLRFLDDTTERVLFGMVFLLFVAIGTLIAVRVAHRWPKDISMDHEGIGYESMRAQVGVDRVPWREIEAMDIFYNRYGSWLRIRLREAPFRSRLHRTTLQRFSMAWDLNIPLSVEWPDQAVLEAAQRRWIRHRDTPRPQ